ncbi:helix-turn-helix domain-containing protein [Azospirillum argentinense]|nr:helix-turn-helix domain-containing protein [Azospirillum argentinense]
MVQESLSISGIILARTMGRTDHLTRRFVRTSEGVAVLEVRSHTAGQWQWAVIDLVLQALPASTLLLGGILMSQGTAVVTIGTMVAMVALQEQLLWPLEEVLRSGVEIRTTRALFARIFDYLDRPVEIRERPDPTVLDRKSIRGAIRLHKVSFAYDGSQRPTIDDVSIDIPAGSHVAIMGATGSGKTTLGYPWTVRSECSMVAVEEQCGQCIRHLLKGGDPLRQRQHDDQAGAKPAGTLRLPSLLRVRDLIAAAPSTPHSAESLERVSCLDRWTLARQFQAAFGTSPSAFRTMRRLDWVRRMIRDGMPFAEAAVEAGCADQSHMSRLFKRTYGLTPVRWAAALSPRA